MTPAFTPRQAETLSLIGAGLPNKAIASRMGISEHTVKDNTRMVFLKLGVSNRAGAAAQAVRMGLA